jgi:hypothetical protein
MAGNEARTSGVSEWKSSVKAAGPGCLSPPSPPLVLIVRPGPPPLPLPPASTTPVLPSAAFPPVLRLGLPALRLPPVSPTRATIRRAPPSDECFHPTSASIRRVLPSDECFHPTSASIRRVLPSDECFRPKAGLNIARGRQAREASPKISPKRQRRVSTPLTFATKRPFFTPPTSPPPAAEGDLL